MKNPFLLFCLWFFFFILEIIFPWEFSGMRCVPWGSWFVLGYACFRLPVFSSLFFTALVFLWVSSFSGAVTLPLLMTLGYWGVILWVRAKTFSEPILGRTLFLFFLIFLVHFLAESVRQDFSISAADGWKMVNLPLGLFLVWWMEEKGSVLEEKYFRLHAEKGQLYLFEARTLEKQARRSRPRLQRRIRKRFGLREGW